MIGQMDRLGEHQVEGQRAVRLVQGRPTVDAAGAAGSGADAGALRARGLAAVPARGEIQAVTVPGCVDGWTTLHEAHGTLPL
ncbi:MAG: gamma-glutamyltransferase, partial [Actinomycetota bacterium]